MPEDTIKHLIQGTLRYLSIRVRSRQEIVDYLAKKQATPDEATAVLTYLDSNQLINDAQFVQSWIMHRLRQGKGDQYIVYELNRKGIDTSLIQQQLHHIDDISWLESMNHLVRKHESKWKGYQEYKQKSMIYQLLRQHGFSGIHIDAFLHHRVK